MKWFVVAFALFSVALLFGCGNESGGGGLTVASLAGDWFGTGDDAGGNPGTISVEMDSTGGLSGDTSIGPPFSGAATQESAQVFSFILSDATEGGFIVDGNASHAGFVDEFFTFGVLEKGAAFIPTYFGNDIVGSWSGIEVETDLVVFTEAPSSLTVTPDFSFSGTTEGISFSGIFTIFSSAFGIYAFASSSINGSGVGQVYVSPDKTFMASWGCLSGGTFPSDCSFNAWSKQ